MIVLYTLTQLRLDIIAENVFIEGNYHMQEMEQNRQAVIHHFVAACQADERGERPGRHRIFKKSQV